RAHATVLQPRSRRRPTTPGRVPVQIGRVAGVPVRLARGPGKIIVARGRRGGAGGEGEGGGGDEQGAVHKATLAGQAALVKPASARTHTGRDLGQVPRVRLTRQYVRLTLHLDIWSVHVIRIFGVLAI